MYLYDGGYHEVVAYQALDLIRRDSEQSDKAVSYTHLLHARAHEAHLRDVLVHVVIAGADVEQNALDRLLRARQILSLIHIFTIASAMLHLLCCTYNINIAC